MCVMRVFKTFGQLLLNHDSLLNVHAAARYEFFLFIKRVKDSLGFGISDFVQKNKNDVFNVSGVFVAEQVGE